MKTLLIATAEDYDVDVISASFSASYRIRRTRDRAGFVASLRRLHPDLAFIDIRLLQGGQNGQLPEAEYRKHVDELWEASTAGPILVISPPGLLREAFKAVKAGVSNYLTSPIDTTELDHVTESIQEFARVRLELDYLRNQAGMDCSEELLRTNSPSMTEVLRKIKLAAPTRTTVLLSGETGVGKSTLAKLIHRLSSRSDRQFIAVHCGAIPDTLLESELFGHEKGAFTGAVRRKRGKFEVADGGTIFLDEVGQLTPAAQIKLLGVLQERSFHRVGGELPINVDVRIITATNEDLKALSEAGDFRRDLFYRVSVFPLEVPPLRERVEDIPLLTEGFLRKLREAMGKDIVDVDPAVLQSFLRYGWPGNVRELENLIERAFILEGTATLTAPSFPAEVLGITPAEPAIQCDLTRPLAEVRRDQVAALERQYLEEALRRTRGRISDAARLAGVGVRQLHKLLVKYGLHKETYRS